MHSIDNFINISPLLIMLPHNFFFILLMLAFVYHLLTRFIFYTFIWMFHFCCCAAAAIGMLILRQCLYKSFGATLLEADSFHFDEFVKNIMQKPKVDDSLEWPANIDQCPSTKRSLFDYFFDCNQAAWIAYDWIVPQYIHDGNLRFNEIFVPTADFVRISQILNQLNNVSTLLLEFETIDEYQMAQIN